MVNRKVIFNTIEKNTQRRWQNPLFDFAQEIHLVQNINNNSTFTDFFFDLFEAQIQIDQIRPKIKILLFPEIRVTKKIFNRRPQINIF